jgi:E3 ubiquitin-protein ligase UBR2
MSTSGGGGCCDCGDSEAWKDHPNCSLHATQAGANQVKSVDLLARIPPEIQARARLVFRSVLKYAYDLLTTSSHLNPPSDLTFKDEHPLLSPMDALDSEDQLYCTIIYNDEVHTFDDVIATIIRAVDCGRDDAIGFATLIDREGRCLVHDARLSSLHVWHIIRPFFSTASVLPINLLQVRCAGFQQCSEIKRTTERITSRRGSRPLKVLIMHSHVVAHQVFAMRQLQWLQATIETNYAFRVLFSQVIQTLRYIQGIAAERVIK